MESNTLNKKERAKQRVADLKGFYVHFSVYIIVNLIITITRLISVLNDDESFVDEFFSFSTFATWFFWGIGVFFHAKKVFSISIFFNKKWEERQIKKYMQEDEDKLNRFK
jgi:hypothetical protein